MGRLSCVSGIGGLEGGKSAGTVNGKQKTRFVRQVMRPTLPRWPPGASPVSCNVLVWLHCAATKCFCHIQRRSYPCLCAVFSIALRGSSAVTASGGVVLRCTPKLARYLFEITLRVNFAFGFLSDMLLVAFVPAFSFLHDVCEPFSLFVVTRYSSRHCVQTLMVL